MKFLIILMISTFSIMAEKVEFKVINKFDFNLALKENCLLDGKNGEDIYEIMISDKCSQNDFQEKTVSCKSSKLIIKTENGIKTFSGKGKCWRKK